MTNRLFIALDIPEEAVKKVLRHRDEIYGREKKIRWEPEEKLHLTLKFLGDVDIEKIPAALKELNNISQRNKTVSSVIDRFGLFKKFGKPKILWAGIKYVPELHSLVEDIDESMSKLGFQKENRAFHPHITLLRVKGYEDQEKINSFVDYELPDTGFTAGTISLYKSRLEPKGSVYENIEKFDLKA